MRVQRYRSGYDLVYCATRLKRAYHVNAAGLGIAHKLKCECLHVLLRPLELSQLLVIHLLIPDKAIFHPLHALSVKIIRPVLTHASYDHGQYLSLVLLLLMNCVYDSTRSDRNGCQRHVWPGLAGHAVKPNSEVLQSKRPT